MASQITELIDKVDNFEIVRLKIAAILKEEQAEQQVLATAAGKDPALWALRVYDDSANPIADWQQQPETPTTVPPVVNVSFDEDRASKSAGNTIDRQQYLANYNLDCFGYGVSRQDGAGHIAGDAEATRESYRCARLVRNILMHGEYTALGLLGTVGDRWMESRTAARPSDGPVEQIRVCRMVLQVRFNETSPQVVADDNLAILFATVFRSPTGEVLLTAQYGEE